MMFSVIIPTFNRAQRLQQAIASIQAQECMDWEIVVVDDGSSDGTDEITKEMADVDARILYVFQNNKGASAARNSGARCAQGDIVVYLDSDDTVSPQFLSEIRNKMKNSEIVFGATNQIRQIVLEDSDGKILLERDPEPTAVGPVSLQDFYHWKVKTTSSGVFHRRAIYSDNVCWDESIKYIEDLDFLMSIGRLYPEGFAFIQEPLVRYTQRYGGDGLCSSAKYKDWANAFDVIYKKHVGDPLLEGQTWWPQRVEKYTQLQKDVENGLEPEAVYKYFPEFKS